LTELVAAPPAAPFEPEADAPVPADREFTVAARAQWKTVTKRFLRHKPAVISLFILTSVTLWAFFFPIFWKWNFTERDKEQLSKGPGNGHPFGTDSLGKDVMALVMRGIQRSLEVALMTSVIAVVIGIVVGAIAGYFRGIVDAILMRFTDLVLTIPLLVIVAVVSVGVPGAPWYTIPVILGLVAWTGLARIVRGEFLSLREKEFVEAARAIGVSDRRIIFRHILPNLAGPIIVVATLAVAGAMLTETALSFLGLGIRPPEVSLGLLINSYQSAFNTRPWLFWFPAVSIVLICLCVNFIGDGLRDAFDPKQNRVRT
jgi:peptide/nickel transport system permease protein